MSQTEKDLIRDNARQARASLTAAERQAASQAACRLLTDTVQPENKVISAYWPIGDEIDTRPFIETATEAGATLCLPVVLSRNAPLVFRSWTSEDRLEAGPHNTRHPSADAPELVPDILIVPLLGFTRQGGRLGYGGGFFDRTLAKLRQNKEILAIGLAYAVQEVAKLPVDAHDQTLDWVVTECEVINCRSE